MLAYHNIMDSSDIAINTILPCETITQILHYLTKYVDVFRGSLTCKYWYEITKNKIRSLIRQTQPDRYYSEFCCDIVMNNRFALYCKLYNQKIPMKYVAWMYVFAARTNNITLLHGLMRIHPDYAGSNFDTLYILVPELPGTEVLRLIIKYNFAHILNYLLDEAIDKGRIDILEILARNYTITHYSHLMIRAARINNIKMLDYLEKEGYKCDYDALSLMILSPEVISWLDNDSRTRNFIITFDHLGTRCIRLNPCYASLADLFNETFKAFNIHIKENHRACFNHHGKLYYKNGKYHRSTLHKLGMNDFDNSVCHFLTLIIYATRGISDNAEWTVMAP